MRRIIYWLAGVVMVIQGINGLFITDHVFFGFTLTPVAWAIYNLITVIVGLALIALGARNHQRPQAATVEKEENHGN